MFNQKIIVTFGFICLLSQAISAPQPDKLNCEAQVKCSFERPRAWASDGENCMVFYNSCHLRNKNCDRLSKGEKILTEINRDQCLKHCSPNCTKELNPICTNFELEEITKTFENPCVLSREMCKTGRAYIYEFQGTCQPN